jgi:hypothetical protein|tara:strand:- start:38 stop:448 length:411 start_codon:yes stop_codon:yes gene_type:complete
VTLQVLRSIGITALISTSVAYFLTNFNISFWSSFLILTVIQIAGWNVFQYIQHRKFSEAQSKQEREIIADLTKQSAVIPCASCGKGNLVPIRFDTNNRFECEHCDKINAVYIDVESVISTNPVDLETTIRINGPTT